MEIRHARLAELKQLIDFYGRVIDQLKNDKIDLGWSKFIYPSAAFLQEAINKDECYIAWQDTQIVGAFILNQEANVGYQQVPWHVEVPTEQVFILHTFATNPAERRRGIAREILAQLFAICKEKEAKAIRLDVVAGNIPAIKLYRAAEFQLIAIIEMTYGEISKEFALYEYPL